MRTLHWIAIGLMALPLGLVACGGDDSTETPPVVGATGGTEAGATGGGGSTGVGGTTAAEAGTGGGGSTGVGGTTAAEAGTGGTVTEGGAGDAAKADSAPDAADAAAE